MPPNFIESGKLELKKAVLNCFQLQIKKGRLQVAHP